MNLGKHLFLSALLGFMIALAIFYLGEYADAAELKSLAIQYDRFVGKTFMPEMPLWEAKEGLSVLFDVDVGGQCSWRNRVHALTDPGQYRLVGWQFEVGCPLPWNLLPNVEFFYHHHSQHILDNRYPTFKFAGVENSLGLTWMIYERGRENGTR